MDGPLTRRVGHRVDEAMYYIYSNNKNNSTPEYMYWALEQYYFFSTYTIFYC